MKCHMVHPTNTEEIDKDRKDIKMQNNRGRCDSWRRGCLTDTDSIIKD